MTEEREAQKTIVASKAERRREDRKKDEAACWQRELHDSGFTCGWLTCQLIDIFALFCPHLEDRKPDRKKKEEDRWSDRASNSKQEACRPFIVEHQCSLCGALAIALLKLKLSFAQL